MANFTEESFKLTNPRRKKLNRMVYLLSHFYPNYKILLLSIHFPPTIHVYSLTQTIIIITLDRTLDISILHW